MSIRLASLESTNFEPYLSEIYSVFDRLRSELDRSKSPNRYTINPSPFARITHYALPLTLTQLEMFEAELCNQGKLNRREKEVLSLTQCAHREISIWRWNALRLGIKSKQMDFYVSLPRYLINLAHQTMRQLIQSIEPTSQTFIEQKNEYLYQNNREGKYRQLSYFAQIARFLIDSESILTPENNKLELLVQVITSRDLTRRRTLIKCKDPSFSIVLPASRSELINLLRKTNS